MSLYSVIFLIFIFAFPIALTFFCFTDDLTNKEKWTITAKVFFIVIDLYLCFIGILFLLVHQVGPIILQMTNSLSHVSSMSISVILDGIAMLAFAFTASVELYGFVKNKNTADQIEEKMPFYLRVQLEFFFFVAISIILIAVLFFNYSAFSCALQCFSGSFTDINSSINATGYIVISLMLYFGVFYALLKIKGWWREYGN